MHYLNETTKADGGPLLPLLHPQLQPRTVLPHHNQVMQEYQHTSSTTCGSTYMATGSSSTVWGTSSTQSTTRNTYSMSIAISYTSITSSLTRDSSSAIIKLVSFQDWILGKVEENAEAHLLRENNWINTHGILMVSESAKSSKHWLVKLDNGMNPSDPL